MSEKLYHLDIITPQRVVFTGEVESFSAPGVLGGFQVLRSHAPLLSALAVGEVKVRTSQGEEYLYATSGGFVEVRENKVVLLADTAERSSEIDVDRATTARGRAEKRISEREKETDIDRARLALHRALNRLRIAGRE
jgi:F-type H+-transporting ATPase subunit epsilon